MKTCLECLHVFKNQTYLGDICPIKDCDGDVIEVDENIISIVHLLNLKGYHTKYSCSGHIDYGYPYLVFEPSVYLDTFDSLPEGFKIDTENKMLIIENRITATRELDRLKALMKAMIDLYKWVNDLPEAVPMGLLFKFLNESDVHVFTEKIYSELHLPEGAIIPRTGNGPSILYFIDISSTKIDEFIDKVEAFAEQNATEVHFDIPDRDIE